MAGGYSWTLKNIISKAQRLANDYRGEWADGERVTLSEMVTHVNDVLLDLSRATRCLKAIGYVPLEAGVYVYTLPENCLALLRLNLSGFDGEVLFPLSVTPLEMTGASPSGSGSPAYWFRDRLAWNQIGIFPPSGAIPDDAFTVAMEQADGIIRRVYEAGGTDYIPFDGDEALRGFDGETVNVMSGEGNILVDFYEAEAAMLLCYARTPVPLTAQNDSPDGGLPIWLHKEIPYAAACKVLENRTDEVAALKKKIFEARWKEITARLIRHQGTIASVSEVSPL